MCIRFNVLFCAGVQAAYLQKGGLKTAVLERRHVFGGAAVSEEIIPGEEHSSWGSVLAWQPVGLRFHIISASYLCSGLLLTIYTAIVHVQSTATNRHNPVIDLPFAIMMCVCVCVCRIPLLQVFLPAQSVEAPHQQRPGTHGEATVQPLHVVVLPG